MDQILFTFRLFSIKIHVSLLYVVSIVLLSYGTKLPIIFALALIIGTIFHEIGHALVLRSIKIYSEIKMVFLGGFTFWQNSPQQQIPNSWLLLLNLAGIFVNILIAAIAFIIFKITGNYSAELFSYINLFLAILNILPILPLDGGKALLSIIRMFSPQHIAIKIALTISIILGILAIFFCIFVNLYIGAFLAVMFTYENFRALKIK